MNNQKGSKYENLTHFINIKFFTDCFYSYLKLEFQLINMPTAKHRHPSPKNQLLKLHESTELCFPFIMDLSCSYHSSCRQGERAIMMEQSLAVIAILYCCTYTIKKYLQFSIRICICLDIKRTAPYKRLYKCTQYCSKLF